MTVSMVHRLGRADRSFVGRWFWTVDKTLLGLVLLLIGLGTIAVAAASPAAALRLSDASHRIPQFFFFQRQLLWALIAIPLLVAVSMLQAGTARRLALAGFLVFLALTAAVPFMGEEVNGATRWIRLPGFNLQPVEFLKPCFIVFTAWVLAAGFGDRRAPALTLSAASAATIAALLALQPDIGQAALVCAVWLAQATLAGLPLGLVGAAVGLGFVGLALAYLANAHVRQRIDSYLLGEGDTYQVDRALDSFRAGGLFGVGPGEGQAKFRLPEAQTDYVFAVIGEEFGALACILIVSLYLVVMLRVLLQALEETDPFLLLATAGLVTQFTGQAMINILVNLALMPAKGMTLPLISHGGSSMLATAMGLGLLLAFTRRNRHLSASPYLVSPHAAPRPAPGEHLVARARAR